MTDQTEGLRHPVVPRAKTSVIKLAWLAALAIATIIPTGLIINLVDERMGRQDEARAAIVRSWGPEQAIGGMRLAMPVTGTDGTPRYASLSPDTLDMQVEMAPEQRRRGFFTSTVYTATVRVTGTFLVPQNVHAADKTIPFPDHGFFLVNLAGLNGVESGDTARVGDTTAAWEVFEETVPGCGPAVAALAVPVTLPRDRSNVPFEAVLHLRGIEAMRFARLAKAMNVTVKGAWPSPSFVGDEPPAKSTMTPAGFDSRWHVDAIGKTQAHVVVCAAVARAPLFGVALVEAMPVYRMVIRATKYAPLFVVLAFAVYFVFELLAGVTITVLQYALMAASLSLFALLLTAISELSGYTWGYVVSAALVIAQASVFTASVVRRRRPALAFAAMLASLFGFLYVLLGLETLALLTGAVALFLVLCIVMAVTQQVYRREPKGLGAAAAHAGQPGGQG